MPILKVLQLIPNNMFIKGSCLREKACDVEHKELQEDWFKQLVRDMFETLYAGPSGVGLAANQVGVLKRVAIIDIKRDATKPLVLINPQYEAYSNEMSDSKEICLCVPHRVGFVQRYNRVKVNYTDLSGDECEVIADGFKSYVCQHEIDHLNGIVYVDLIKDEGNLIEYSSYEAEMAKKAVANALVNETG